MTDTSPTELTRADVDALSGAAMLEFGTSWCGFCRASQPRINAALRLHPDVRHFKIEDGSGLALGRSFGVKLSPTLIFLRDGAEQSRLVRPHDTQTIDAQLNRIASTA